MAGKNPRLGLLASKAGAAAFAGHPLVVPTGLVVHSSIGPNAVEVGP